MGWGTRRGLKKEEKDTGEQKKQLTGKELEAVQIKQEFIELIDDIMDEYSKYSPLHQYMVKSLKAYMVQFNIILDIYDKDHPEKCGPDVTEQPEHELEEESKPWWKRVFGADV